MGAMRKLILIVTLAVLALPGTALASSGARTATAAFPFTTNDIFLLVGGGIVLTAAGRLARRLTSYADPSREQPGVVVSGSVTSLGTERQAVPGFAQAAGGR